VTTLDEILSWDEHLQAHLAARSLHPAKAARSHIVRRSGISVDFDQRQGR
jgi:hypothetical protein